MDKKPCCTASNHLALGLVAIGFGTLFLLRNLGFIPAESVGQLWPLVFVLLGVLKIALSRGRGLLWGCALIVLGSTMTLSRLNLIVFSWHDWWPVLLIALGLSVLFRRGGRRLDGCCGLPWQEVKGGEDEETIDATAIMGGYKRQIRAQRFKGGSITAVMGGCEIDLRNASIEGEAVLDVVAFWGGIKLKVPADWTVILQGSGILGGFVEKTRMPADASKRLIVRGYAIMGGFEVRN